MVRVARCKWDMCECTLCFICKPKLNLEQISKPGISTSWEKVMENFKPWTSFFVSSICRIFQILWVMTRFQSNDKLACNYKLFTDNTQDGGVSYTKQWISSTRKSLTYCAYYVVILASLSTCLQRLV